MIVHFTKRINSGLLRDPRRHIIVHVTVERDDLGRFKRPDVTCTDRHFVIEDPEIIACGYEVARRELARRVDLIDQEVDELTDDNER